MASAASEYTRINLLKALLQGVAFPLPPHTYISLHTADPVTTGANEATTGAYPAYVRKQAEAGGAMGSGWTAPAADISKNANQLTWPGMNGGANITITHWGLWDAANGGNYLVGGALQTSRTLQPGDVFVFDVNALQVNAS